MTPLNLFAITALLLCLYQTTVVAQAPPPLAGHWQYLQPPDSEGEVLDLSVSADGWHGIMNGLERAGEHGLFYYVVEVENLSVQPDGAIRFEIGERQLFIRRPALSRLTGQGDGGVDRYRMRFNGEIEGEELVLQCRAAYGSCPDATLRFKRLETTR